ncbi:hypothetical protein FisN_4Lh522 [Fistulifera solaris]|uniref:C3H1-type domain-containing protein n=1 Tax=Fistulifera solaris TaxID=1519565 RepID=A0A1Z5KDL3_FISSO|nr:hypothetical protein FisN_4Lh522 [Fistulifera solaris]|eukprot:GAX24390.1 hypothetical protein FisN_4Lh522 [Fistulifera solaris]
MSMPPLYATPTGRGGSEQPEDCRDFLRTGRCKYGASCKYNHPANVQSGGGMKSPLDPSEPLFPLRPNEPLCQYYLKHGTCKFGQACKFNHPPHTSQRAILNGNSIVLMNIGRQNGETPQYVLNPDSSVLLQVLPQRPDEPDCIYFLKNGRCKYGATCRYHHPLNYHQQRAEEQRRHRNQMSQQGVHYVTQHVSGMPHQGPIYLDNSIAVVPVDREGHQLYQYSYINNSDGYSAPLGSTVRTELASSASSLASSYDAALEQIGHSDRGSSNWNRTLSVNSLGESRGPPRGVMTHSASEGHMDRRPRAASHGNTTDYIFESNSGQLRRISSETPMNANPSPVAGSMNGESWQGQRGRFLPKNRRGRHRDDVEGGFTMMTSALLNMLDTTEEASGENFSDEDNYHAHHHYLAADEVDHSLFERLSLNSAAQGGGYVPSPVPNTTGGNPNWPTTWEGLSYDDQDLHLSMLSKRESDRRQGSPSENNVGLYLP